MKKILTSIAILGLISFLSACPGKEEKAEAPAEAPAAEAAAPAAEAAAPAADPSLEKKVMDAAQEVKKTL